jgi:predicted nucleic acid-binding protein
MAVDYIFDACALLAFIYDETGADIVQDVLEAAEKNNITVYMNKLNLFEVYYNVRREEGELLAETLLDMVKKLPIRIIDGISDEVFREAGRIKSNYKISLADAIVLGEASVNNAKIVTSDHHEFNVIESNENIAFHWIR